MRLLRLVARKSLLALGYPRLETSHPELGIHEVGALRARMAPDVPACQFFYPVEDKRRRRRFRRNHSRKRFVPYYREQAVDGLLDFLGGFGDGVAQMLQEKSHPLENTYGADPLTTQTNAGGSSLEEGFPLVLFSHGLSGTMEMYTELCAQIASTGCVVVAVEHEDGSASHAASVVVGSTGTEEEIVAIPYKRPSGKLAEGPYSRQKVLEFRTPMLEQRVKELENIYNRFLRRGTDDDDPNEVFHTATTREVLEVLQKIVSSTDPSRLHLVGHSFGGATQLLAAQTWAKATISEEASVEALATTFGSGEPEAAPVRDTAAPKRALAARELPRESSSSPPIPLSITAFDAWNFALSDQVLRDGLSVPPPRNGSSPAPPVEILSVLSEAWATVNPEREQTLEFLRNCDPTTTHVRSCYAKHSVHQSVSDTESWLPSLAAQSIGNRGRGERRHRTIRGLVAEIAKFAHPPRAGAAEGTKETENDSQTVLVPLPLE
jgi:dienelactone hydrolase